MLPSAPPDEICALTSANRLPKFDDWRDGRPFCVWNDRVSDTKQRSNKAFILYLF